MSGFKTRRVSVLRTALRPGLLRRELRRIAPDVEDTRGRVRVTRLLRNKDGRRARGESAKQTTNNLSVHVYMRIHPELCSTIQLHKKIRKKRV